MANSLLHLHPVVSRRQPRDIEFDDAGQHRSLLSGHVRAGQALVGKDRVVLERTGLRPLVGWGVSPRWKVLLEHRIEDDRDITLSGVERAQEFEAGALLLLKNGHALQRTLVDDRGLRADEQRGRHDLILEDEAVDGEVVPLQLPAPGFLSRW